MNEAIEYEINVSIRRINLKRIMLACIIKILIFSQNNIGKNWLLKSIKTKLELTIFW